MKLLSKLLGRRSEPTRLQAFLERLGPEQVMKAAADQRNVDLRAAAAIALTTLMVAGRFARSTQERVEELRGQMHAPKAPALSYDVLVFESAAYCCHQLMRGYVGSSHKGEDEGLDGEDDEDDDFDEDDDNDDDDPNFEALRDAAHLTGGIIGDHTAFNLASEFFLHRILSYGLRGRDAGPSEAEDFELVLSSSLAAGTPAAGRRGPLSLDLALGLALKMGVRSFEATMVPALRESARRMYDHDWD